MESPATTPARAYAAVAKTLSKQQLYPYGQELQRNAKKSSIPITSGKYLAKQPTKELQPHDLQMDTKMGFTAITPPESCTNIHKQHPRQQGKLSYAHHKDPQIKTKLGCSKNPQSYKIFAARHSPKGHQFPSQNLQLKKKMSSTSINSTTTAKQQLKEPQPQGPNPQPKTEIKPPNITSTGTYTATKIPRSTPNHLQPKKEVGPTTIIPASAQAAKESPPEEPQQLNTGKISYAAITSINIYAAKIPPKDPQPNPQDLQLKTERSSSTSSLTGACTPKRLHPRAWPKNLSPEKCLARLSRYVTIEKPCLSKILLDVGVYADQAEVMVESLIADGCCQPKAVEFSLLTLYDLVILIDDSSSMLLEDGERIKTLKHTLEKITDIYALANKSGIKSIRFLNNKKGKDDVKTKADVEDLIGHCSFTGTTKIGTELKRKVLEPFVLHEGPMKRPLLVMIITDGQGEKGGALVEVIQSCVSIVTKRSDRGSGAVAFQFSRVGSDKDTIKLLTSLDEHPGVGDHVNCLPPSMSLDTIKNASDSNKQWTMLSILLLGGILPYIAVSEEYLNLTGEVVPCKGLKNTEVFDEI